MINEQFGIDHEHPVQYIFVFYGHPGDVAKSVHPGSFKSCSISPTNPPEICQRPMCPHFFPEGSLVQLCDPHTVLVCLNMLRLNIHSNFAQKKIRPDTGCRCDPGGLQNVPDHPHGKVAGCQFVELQIGSRVDKHLVDGINVNILGRDVFQVNRIRVYP